MLWWYGIIVYETTHWESVCSLCFNQTNRAAWPQEERVLSWRCCMFLVSGLWNQQLFCTHLSYSELSAQCKYQNCFVNNHAMTVPVHSFLERRPYAKKEKGRKCLTDSVKKRVYNSMGKSKGKMWILFLLFLKCRYDGPF